MSDSNIYGGLHFNPRPRKEGDVYHDIMCIGSLSISIHALVKRATDWDANFPDMYDISIHALVKRATSFGSLDIERLNISIHALVKRATYLSPVKQKCTVYFNPRPRKEGDPAVTDKLGGYLPFQSTPS